MKLVNAAPPVANVYVVVPTLALSFASPPTIAPDTFTVSGDVELVATAEKSTRSPDPDPVWTNVSLPLPARKVFSPRPSRSPTRHPSSRPLPHSQTRSPRPRWSTGRS